MPQISIVIPFFGDEKSLEATLVSVLENRPMDCEVIVAHKGDYSDPYDLQEEVQFVESDASEFTIASVIRRVLTTTNAPVIHLLAAGLLVQQGWTDDISTAFEDPYIGSACPVLLDSEERVLGIGVENTVFFHNRYLGAGKQIAPSQYTAFEPVGPTQLAGFYRRSALEEISCLSEFSDNQFGLETGLALEAIGYENKVVESTVVIEDGVVLPQATGAESQKSIWRFAGSIGWFQGLALSAAAIACDLLKSPFRANARKSLVARISGMIDSRTAESFRDFVDHARGPQPDGATVPMTKGNLSLSGFIDENERRAA